MRFTAVEMSLAQETQLLELLHSEAVAQQLAGLWHGIDGEAQKARDDWSAREYAPMDTSGAPFRNLHVTQIYAALSEAAMAAGSPLNPWLRITDCYLLTGMGDTKPVLRGRATALAGIPLLAIKVRQTVFDRDMASGVWSARPWLGVDHDPLLALPYSRKYDYERAQIAEHIEQHQWEALERAGDIVELMRRRLAELDLRAAGNRFIWPQLDDLQAELAKDDLTIGIDDFALWAGGGLRMELRQLETAARQGVRSASPQRMAHGHPLAEGAYRGPLTQLRSFSASSMKRMLLEACAELAERIFELAHPLDEEELEARKTR